MEVITGGIMQAKLSVALFPTNRFELPGFLLIHKFASLATAFRPVLLAHRLGFKLAALSLVAVPRIVCRPWQLLLGVQTTLTRALFRGL